MTATAASSTLRPPSDELAQFIIKEWQESILLLNQDKRVTFANEFFCDWAAIAWPKVEGQLLENLLGTPAVSEFLSDVLSCSAARDCQIACEMPGIGKRILLLSANPLVHSDLPVILLEISDVSDRKLSTSMLTRKMEVAKREESSQRKEAALLRSIMESSGDGIFVADVEGNCVLWNRTFEEVLGVKPESLRHLKMKDWTEFFGVYLDDKVTPYPVKDLPLSRALNGETCDNVQLWIRNKSRPNGLWISVTAHPLTGGQDGAMATIRDVTFSRNATEELATLAEEVARSNRDLEQFAYVAAHDLQEPLRMISSYVQLIAKRYKGKLDADADEFIGHAIDGAKRMSQLINDLLTYSRIGRGKMPEEEVDCEKVLEQVLHSLSQKNAASGAEITHDPLPKIMANELQITQVLQNLIDNAVKFRSEENPRVHISAREEGTKWIFSVADNGIGIEEQYKDKVFVIFQRLNSREEYGGTGIGLAVVKKIVEKRDGEVWFAPNQGRGTVVYFTWP
jgi:signal transduction histidine kinase